MPFGPTDVFWIGVVPAIVAALVMWALNRLALRPTATWTAAVTSALVIGMFAQNVRVSWPTAFDKLFHPRVALDWLPWLVLAAAGITLLAAYAPRHWQRWLLAVACVFALTIPARLLAGSVYVTTRWSTLEKLGVLALWSLLFAALWLTLSLGRPNRQPLLRSGLLLVVTLGIAVTITASGAITVGELAGVAAATLCGSVAVAWFCGTVADGPSHSAGPLAVMLGSLILLGHFYAQLSATHAACLAISVAAAAGWLPKIWPRKPLAEAALRSALTLIPLAIAVISAVAATTADPYR